ncbi:MAG: hypothetical protein Q7T03_02225 [Deltaproteobacteria bacterium]|nr:hypothetical protein [Deltaproteobacteria bacterium]
MSNNHLDIKKFYAAIKTVYKDNAYLQTKKVFEENGLQERVDVYQGEPNDGIVLLSDSKINLQGSLPATVDRFLVALTAGKSELKNPLKKADADSFEIARQIYQCRVKDNFEQECLKPARAELAERNNAEADDLLLFSASMVRRIKLDAKKEARSNEDKVDRFFGFKEKPELGEAISIYKKYRRQVDLIDKTSLEGSEQRLAMVRDKMIPEILAESEGVDACVVMGQCTIKEGSSPDCDEGEIVHSEDSYLYKEQVVFTSAAFCEEEPEKSTTTYHLTACWSWGSDYCSNENGPYSYDRRLRNINERWPRYKSH